jgi:hypothetical protein
LYIGDYEGWLRGAVRRYLSALSDQGMHPPIFLFLSLLNAGNCRLLNTQNYYFESPNMVDHNVASFPEITIYDADSDLDVGLKVVFDALWNAAGSTHSPSFDSSGVWCGHGSEG